MYICIRKYLYIYTHVHAYQSAMEEDRVCLFLADAVLKCQPDNDPGGFVLHEGSLKCLKKSRAVAWQVLYFGPRSLEQLPSGLLLDFPTGSGKACDCGKFPLASTVNASCSECEAPIPLDTVS